MLVDRGKAESMVHRVSERRDVIDLVSNRAPPLSSDLRSDPCPGGRACHSLSGLFGSVYRNRGRQRTKVTFDVDSLWSRWCWSLKRQ